MNEFFLVCLGWVLAKAKSFLQPFVKVARFYLVGTPKTRLFIEMSVFGGILRTVITLYDHGLIKSGSPREEKIFRFIRRRRASLDARYERDIVPTFRTA